MRGRRGLSAVVTTLLIILLSLVAIGVVWVVVQGVIQSGAEQIELGQFTLDLEIKAVQINGDTAVVTVVVKRNPGQGEFVGMNFIFSDGKNSETKRENVSLDPLDERTFVFELDELDASELVSVSVAPIYLLSSGRESPGDPADMFDIKKGMSVAGTGGAVSAFAKLGYSGVGEKSYTFSTENQGLPEFKEAIVDPLDVLPGNEQTFTVYVYSPNGIGSVSSVTQLDNSVSELDFVKTGDGFESEIWSVTWEVEDVHTTTYRTHITAVDNQGNSNSINLTWTDSCQSQIDHGQPIPVVLSTSCTTGIGAVAGIDGGSLELGQDAILTIDDSSLFLFNQGTSIEVTASGAQIVSTSNGSFGNAYLYGKDADGDTHPNEDDLDWNTEQTWSGHTRAKDITEFDCRDDEANVHRIISSTRLDTDNDGWVTGENIDRCVGNSSVISGRTYYKSTGGTFDWIQDSQKVGDGDCDSNTDADTYQLISSVKDADQDGYNVTSIANNCVGSSTSANGRTYYKDSAGSFTWLAAAQRLGNDCYDLNANAKPGQTSYFTSTRGGGTDSAGNLGSSYDYNCVSGEEKQYTLVDGACYSRQECLNIEIQFECTESSATGSVGWTTASSPDCGASGTYVSNGGLSFCEWGGETGCDVGPEETACSSGSQTQACK
jgi:hypothetical protein